MEQKLSEKGISSANLKRLRARADELNIDLNTMIERLLDNADSDILNAPDNFFQLSPDYMVLIDRTGAVQRANPIYAEMLGYTPETIIGKNIVDFIHPDDREPTALEAANIQLGRYPGRFINRYRDRDNQMLWIEWTGYTTEDDLIYCIGRDVTGIHPDDVKLRTQRIELDAIFTQAQDAIIIVDNDQIFVDANPAAARLFGRPLDEVIGLKIHDVIVTSAEDFAPAWEAFKTGSYDVGEIEVLHPDGTIRTAEFQSRANFLPGKHVSILRDVTDRKLAESQIQQVNEFVESIYRAIPNFIYIYDFNQDQQIFGNSSFKSITGYTAEEIQAMGSAIVRYVVYPDDKRRVLEHFEKLRTDTTGQIYELEYRIVHRDTGEPIWVNDRSLIFKRDANGQPVQLLGSLLDVNQRKLAEESLNRTNQMLEEKVRDRTFELTVTNNILEAEVYERQQVEKALRESEQRYRKVSEMSTDYAFSYRVKPDGRIALEWITSAFETVTGYTRADAFSHLTWRTLVHPEDISKVVDHLKIVSSVAAWGEEEIRLMRKDGTIRYAMIQFSSEMDDSHDDNRVTRIYGSVRDITERRLAEERISERERQIRLLTENATDLIGLHDIDTTYVYVSPAGEQITGYEATEMIGQRLTDFIHPDDLERVKSQLAAFEKGDIASLQLTYRLRTKSGIFVWLETALRSIVDQGKLALVSVSRDVSDRRRIQEQLRRERDLLERLMRTSPAAIVMLSPQGEITFANDRAEYIFRLAKSEITDRTYDDPRWRSTDLDGSPWPDEKQPFVIVSRTKQPVYNIQHAIEFDDGERILLSINGAPVLTDDGELESIVFSIEDITVRKRAELELTQMLEKERQLNELKSRFLTMVSHEFRTPLTIIQTSTEIMRSYYDRLTPEKRELRTETILAQVKRINSMIDDISYINRASVTRHTLRLEMVGLHTFFEQTVTEVEMAFDDVPPIVLIATSPADKYFTDETLLYQIVSNLLSNAVKYTPADGRVTVRYTADDRGLLIEVIDTGIGIPPEDQQYIFDLFHRSSNVGSIPGTGMGLVITKYAIDALNGLINFTSDVDEGTTFTVKLPPLA